MANGKGGNDPIRAAALQNIRASASGQNAPNQLPQGQDQQGGETVPDLLARALRLIIANGGDPGDVAAVEQFLMSIQKLPEQLQSQAPQGGAPAQPLGGSAPAAPINPQG